MKRAAIVLGLLLIWLIPGLLAQDECKPCSPKKQKQELIEIYRYYRDAVNDARKIGYQCGSDANYVDYGPLKTKLGNCADWAWISWIATATHTWECWRIVKVRARRQFWFNHHNFVYIQPKCGGTRIYLDPWKSGRPDVFIGDAFPAAPGFLGWVNYPLATHQPGDPPINPNK